MVNYSNAVIYTIRTGDSVYVGSTCNFKSRKHQHNSSIHNEKNEKYNRKLYKTIRENDGEWDMQPHKLFPCKNKMEMNIEEERCRKELNADLNSQSCHGYDKEKYAERHKKYRENHKEYFKEYMKQYRIDNKETIIKNYTEKITCECGCEITKGGFSKHKNSNKHIKLLEEKHKNNTDA